MARLDELTRRFHLSGSGARTGAAAGEFLHLYPRSTAILTDFSPQMMDEGEREMQQFAGRKWLVAGPEYSVN